MSNDRASSLFWLLLSIFVFIESLHIGIGTPHNPAGGFFALCASGVLGLLSLMLFLQTFVKKESAQSEPLFAGMLWQRVLLVVIALIVYAAVMPMLGYLISTFSLMSLLFFILEPGRIRWLVWSLIISFLTTGISYYVFSVLLNCQFPAGLLGP
jgi:hypothetical protein